MVAGDISGVLQIGIDNGLNDWNAEGYLRELGREDSLIFVAKLDKINIGFIALRLIKIYSKKDENEAEIHNFAVAKHFQKQGIGAKLLQQAIKAEKPRKIWLEVRKSNDTAVKFYIKNGFQVIGERKNYYINPLEDALLMKLETTFEY